MGTLSVKTVQALKGPGKFGDGDGLYLHISAGGAKSWIVRTRIKGETARREIGLGGISYVSLAGHGRRPGRSARRPRGA